MLLLKLYVFKQLPQWQTVHVSWKIGIIGVIPPVIPNTITTRQTRKTGPMYYHIWHYIGPMYSQSCQRWSNFPGLSGNLSYRRSFVHGVHLSTTTSNRPCNDVAQVNLLKLQHDVPFLSIRDFVLKHFLILSVIISMRLAIGSSQFTRISQLVIHNPREIRN